MIGFHRDVRVHVVEEDVVARFDPQGLTFFNINTPDDLQTAERLLAAHPEGPCRLICRGFEPCFPALTSPDVVPGQPGRHAGAAPRHRPDGRLPGDQERQPRGRLRHQPARPTRWSNEARQAMADFVNAPAPEEIVFGANMTTPDLQPQPLPGAASCSPATRSSSPASITTPTSRPGCWRPRTAAARCAGSISIRRTARCDLDQTRQRCSRPRTRLVAVGYASNAVGTINPVAAHRRAGPRRRRAVLRRLRCTTRPTADRRAGAGLRFPGGLGLQVLRPTRRRALRPARAAGACCAPTRCARRPIEPPGKFETGTGNFEGLAGTLGAVEYLAGWARPSAPNRPSVWPGRSPAAAAPEASHERHPGARDRDGRALLDALQAVPGLTVYGIDGCGVGRTARPDRVLHAARAAPAPGGRGARPRGNIYVWDGNYYALAVTERLGLEDSGGMVRVGLAHYNTPAEIERLGAALRRLAAAKRAGRHLGEGGTQTSAGRLSIVTKEKVVKPRAARSTHSAVGQEYPQPVPVPRRARRVAVATACPGG